CAGARQLIGSLGLDEYYARRSLDPAARPVRPEEAADQADPAAYVRPGPDGTATLHLLVEGIQCGACIWLIETVLGRMPGVVRARLSMTTRRLTLAWREGETDARTLMAAVAALG